MTVMMMVMNYVSTPSDFIKHGNGDSITYTQMLHVWYIWMMFGVNVDESSSTMVRINGFVWK